MDELPQLLDSYDRLVAAAADAAPSGAVENAAEIGRRARARRGYLGDTVVVALAGGTGSGKSSTVNALAGEEVAATSSRRPTTSRPMAWIPANPEPGLVRLLDDIGIDHRVGQDTHPDLAVIDLPDIDSVEIDHRQTVEELLPEVDAIVWVVDPEKYQDRILHRDHLAPLAGYQDQFVFVLNQIDRVPAEDLDAVVEDFRTNLERDGIAGPVIIATAADPPIGPPVGIEDLESALREMGSAKGVVHRKLLTDLERGAADLAAAAGVTEGGGTGFAERWRVTLEEAAGHIASDVLDGSVVAAARKEGRRTAQSAVGLLPGASAPTEIALSQPGTGVLAAARTIDELATSLSTEIGGEVGAEIRSVGASIDDQVAKAADTVRFGTSLPLPRPPEWTSAVAWLRRLAVIGLVFALVWLYQSIRSGDDLIAPLAAVATSLALMAGPWLLAGASGASRAEAAVRASRRRFVDSGASEIDRRLGRPLRDVLRKRAGAAAAWTDFELAMRELARDAAEDSDDRTRSLTEPGPRARRRAARR